MHSPHSHWGAEALRQQLAPLLPGISVEVAARVDSTNTRLFERARQSSGQHDTPITRPGELVPAPSDARTPHGRRAGDTQPCLLVAEHQTRGRGRLGRNWISSEDHSLTFSLSLPLAPSDWSGLSLVVGLALAQALDPSSGTPRIGLKWPNDLWLWDGPGRGRKLGGVLIETISVGQRRMCVVGVGLNIWPQPAEGVSSGYACLQELIPAANAPCTLAIVAEPLVRALLQFQANGFAPFAAGYARRDLLLGQAVNTSQADVPEGIADGVDERGALRVRAGGVHTLVSGEVSVRLQAC
jgi:BirA family transcriptional regulator, biotin operon repressor / biotin---[acetyl-CoA-carboxylase] ligase